MDRCDIPRCRAVASITYLGRGVCERHWISLTADDVPSDTLRMALGLHATPDAATEGSDMDDGSKKAEAAQAAPAKGKRAKAPKAAKPAKESKPKREKVENPVVFAFRLSEADRTKIHEAAGPAGATRFVRAAALAAATGDSKAFEALVAQAKANLK